MDIAKKLIQHIKHTDNINDHIEYVEDRPFNDLRYSVSNAKLVSLGWNESIPFEEGFKSTIDWYMSCPDDYWIHS
jgi:dTDP-D-glucose 4,6-dehydratase